MMGHLWSYIVLASLNVAMWSSLLTGNLKFLPWELHINCAWNTKLSDVPTTPYTFNWWLVWILGEQLAIMTELFYVFLSLPWGKFQDITAIRSWLLPFKPIPSHVHEFSYQSTAHSVAVVKQATKEAKMEFSAIS